MPVAFIHKSRHVANVKLNNSDTIKRGLSRCKACNSKRQATPALAAANAGFNLKQGADAIQVGQGDANGMVKNAVSCPSVRNTSRVEFQSPFFQKSGFRGWFLMGLLHMLVLRCACFLCKFRHSRRLCLCPMRTVLFELSWRCDWRGVTF